MGVYIGSKCDEDVGHCTQHVHPILDIYYSQLLILFNEAHTHTVCV